MGRTLTLVIAIVFMVTACNGATTDTDGSSPSESSGGSQTSQTDDSLAGGADTTEAATETTETSAPVSGGGDGGECTINVSGDLEETIVYPQSAFTFASDYWASEEELREVIEFFGEDNSGGSYEEIVASGEPILGWFMFNCVDPDDPGSGVVVLPTNDTT